MLHVINIFLIYLFLYIKIIIEKDRAKIFIRNNFVIFIYMYND